MSTLPTSLLPARSDLFRHPPLSLERPERPERPAAQPQPPRRLTSNELLDGEREVEIEHAGAVYRLRRTSLGKLILTK